MALSPNQKLGAAFLRVTDVRNGWAPYFGSIMHGFIRRETAGLGTLAVSKDGILFWDPEFVNKHSVEEIAAGLMHEAMHVMLKFFERASALGVVPEPTPEARSKSAIANLAHDACINSELRKMQHCDLPKTWAYPDTLSQWGFKDQSEGLIFEERYRLMLQDAQNAQSGSGSGSGNGDGGAEGQNGDMKPAVGQGWCGSCGAHPIPGEPKGEAGKTEGRSEAEMDRFRRETAEAIKTSKDAGNIPASFKRWADEMLAPPKIDWRAKLARLVRAAVAYRPGAVDFTWTRPSRRQAGIGYGVGRALVPAYHAPQPNVMVAIDSSGSMSEKDLAAALSETQGVLAAVGSDITYCVCDADVHTLRRVKTWQEAAEGVVGGGGTDFRPVFSAAASSVPRPQVLVFFTDGCGPAPEMQPADIATVWCLVGQYVQDPPWGDVVRIEE